MRILFITTRFHPHVGGVENVVENLAGKLAKKHEVSVVNSLDTNSLSGSRFIKGFKIELSEKPFSKNERVKDKKIWINLPKTFFGYLSFPYRFIFSSIALLKYAGKFDPDVINYHFPDDSSIYIWIFGLFNRTPLVTNIHGNDLHVFAKKSLQGFFIKKILTKSKVIIVNSTYMKKDLSNFIPTIEDKVKIISNGLDVDQFKSVTKKSEYRQFKKPYVFYIGRLVHKKGVDILLEAVKKANLKDLKFVIEGKGEELDSLKKQAKRLDIDEQIIFTEGNINNENGEKVWIMKEAEFGIIPSRVEPFGIVALEFMAAGTPIIVSKTGGLENIIVNGETGMFFKNGNVDDLVEKIKHVHLDGSLRIKLAEKELNEVKKYSWGNISQEYLDAFKNLCK